MSSLSKQLGKLQLRSAIDHKLGHSFLFADADAKQLSREQVHQLAIAGLQTLLNLDNRFHPFLNTMFHPDSIRKERQMNAAADNAALDKQIDRFLTLLSPHLLLTCSHQVLEYLVRVLEVQTFNVTSVLRAFLPFHDHAIFARMLLLLDLRDTGFGFLEPNQLNGAVLPRSSLITACAENRKVLRAVCDTAAFASRMQVQNNAAHALFTGIATSLATHPESESIFRVLLPYICSFVDENYKGAIESTGNVVTVDEGPGSHQASASDVSAASLVMCGWCHHCTLSSKSLAAFLRPFLNRLTRPDFPLRIVDALGVVGIILSAQQAAVADTAFQPILKNLLALPWADWQGMIAHKMTSSSAAILGLVGILIQISVASIKTACALSAVPSQVLQVISLASASFPIRHRDVKLAVTAIVHHPRIDSESVDDEPEEEARALLLEALRNLNRRFHAPFDEVVAGILSDASSLSSKADDATTHMAAEVVLRFLSAQLGASSCKYDMIDVASVFGTRKTSSKNRCYLSLPLFACLLHHLPEVRCIGIARLTAMTHEELLKSGSSGGANLSLAAGSDGADLLDLLCQTIEHESIHTVRMKCVSAASKHIHAALAVSAEGRAEVAAKLLQAVFAMLQSQNVEGRDGQNKALAQEILSSIFLPLTQVATPTVTTPTPASAKKKTKLSAEPAASTVQFPVLPACVVYYGLLFSHFVSEVLDPVNGIERTAADIHALLHLILPNSEAALSTKQSGNGTTPASQKSKRNTQNRQEVRPAEQVYADSSDDEKSAVHDLSPKSALRNGLLLSHLQPFVLSSRRHVLSSALKSLGSPELTGAHSYELLLVVMSLLHPATANDATDCTSIVVEFVSSYVGKLRIAEERTVADAARSGATLSFGRGVKAADSLSAAVPQDEFVRKLAAQLLSGALAAARTAEGGDAVAALRARAMVDLLVVAHAPLPLLTAAPFFLSSVFLAVLSRFFRSDMSESDLAKAEAVARLVQNSILAKPNDGSDTALSHQDRASWCADPLLLILVTPVLLSSRREVRQPIAELLQRAVLDAPPESASNLPSKPTSGLQKVISGAIQQSKVSRTTLNSLIERIALGPTATILPLDAARLVASSWIASETLTTSAPQLCMRLLELFFPRSMFTASAQRITSPQQAALAFVDIVSPFVVGLINSQASSGQDGAHFALSENDGNWVLIESVLNRLTDVSSLSLPEASIMVLTNLAESLLRVPYARSRNGSVHATYRFGLTILDRALTADATAAGVDADSAPLIFSRKPKAAQTSPAVNADTIAKVRELLLRHLARHAPVDVASLLATSLGGFQRILKPLLTDLFSEVSQIDLGTGDATKPKKRTRDSSGSKGSPQQYSPRLGSETLDLVALTVEQLSITEAPTLEFNSGAPVWHPATTVIGHLTTEDVVALSYEAGWSTTADNSVTPTPSQLRLQRAIVRVLPFVVFPDESAVTKEDAEPHTFFSTATFVLSCVEHRARTMIGTLSQLSKSGMTWHDVLRTLDLLSELALVLTQNKTSLDHPTPGGSSQALHRLVRSCFALVTSALNTTATSVAHDNQSEVPGEVPWMAAVTKLVQIIAPALAALATCGEAESSDALSVLHIPFLGIFMRLEPLNGTAALQYKTNEDVCLEILKSLDIFSQMNIIGGIAQLLANNGHLAPNQAQSEVEASAATALSATILKPNKVVNRQEEILNLLAAAVKQDAFLGPFIDVQHKSRSKSATGRFQGKKSKAEEELEAAGEKDEDGGEEAHDALRNDTCMNLLMRILSLFSHYHTLHSETPQDEHLPDGDSAKCYTLLLELLSGNVLACVLAGINESTFVECLLRLLGDSSPSIQHKGLEILLDRLRQALPTTEHTLDEDAAAQRLRDLRDPRKKLSYYDLVALKAKPLVTKRSFALFSPMLRIASSTFTALKSIHHATLATLLQLSVACMEEVVRIVGFGGSVRAEIALLAGSTADANLTRAFGQKRAVGELHQFLDFLLSSIRSFLKSIRDEQTTHAGALQPHCLLGSLLAAIGTVALTCGNAFMSDHANVVLQRLAETCHTLMKHSPSAYVCSPEGSVVRRAALRSLARCLPTTWLMVHPFVPELLSFACWAPNIDDDVTANLSMNVVDALRGLLEPRVLLEAAAGILGASESIVAAQHQISSLVPELAFITSLTHHLPTFFGLVQSLVSGMSKPELGALPLLTSGGTADSNMWIAALSILAGTTSSSVGQLPNQEIRLTVFRTYESFFLKFKEKHCSRFLATLVQWAFASGDETTQVNTATKTGASKKRRLERSNASSAGSSDEQSGSDEDDTSAIISSVSLRRWIMLLGLYKHLLDKLGGIMSFSFSLFLKPTVSILTRFNGGGRSKQQHSLLVPMVLDAALSVIGAMSKAQNDSRDPTSTLPEENFFARPDVFNGLAPALIQQLGNTSHLTSPSDSSLGYAFQVSRTLIPAIRNFFKTLDSTKLYSKTQQELLRQLRSNESAVRKATLQAFRAIYEDGGDMLASMAMAEVLPAIVEATEDSNDAVVEEARLLCNELSSITGQDVLHAMA